MKVLRKGIKKGDKPKPGPWSQRFVCSSCTAVLEVVEKDLYVVNTGFGVVVNNWAPRLRFDCGDCGSINDATDKVPENIQSKIFKKVHARHIRNST